MMFDPFNLIECFGSTHRISTQPVLEILYWNPVLLTLTDEQHGWMEASLNTVEWEWCMTRWPEGAEL